MYLKGPHTIPLLKHVRSIEYWTEWVSFKDGCDVWIPDVIKEATRKAIIAALWAWRSRCLIKSHKADNS